MGEMSLSHRLGNAFGATKAAETAFGRMIVGRVRGKIVYFGIYLLKWKLYYDLAVSY